MKIASSEVSGNPGQSRFLRGALRVALACNLSLFAAYAMAQGQAVTHTVGEKDNVLALAKKYKYPNASMNQMALAMVRANPQAFEVNSQRQLKVGYALQVPAAETVLKTDAQTADKEMARLVKADGIYRKGVAAEKNRDMKAALRSYLTAAHMGHGLADYRLGQLYDRDNTKTVPHDLQESIRFYQEARKKGINIEGPIQMSPNFGGTR